MRAAGVGCLLDTRGGKFAKRLERAGRAGVYYLIILGPDEIAAGKVTLRDMDEKTSETLDEVTAIGVIVSMVLTSEERRVAAACQAVNDALQGLSAPGL